MNRSLVLTIMSPDRPGLVETVASILGARHGNWLESRMCRLGGQFAGILRCTVPEEEEDSLRREMASLASHGLQVMVFRDEGSLTETPVRRYQLEFHGTDRPGIVRDVSSLLARHGINVEELESSCTSAPMSGEVLFRASATVAIPLGCSLDNLQAQLEMLAEDLMVDLHLHEVQP